MHGNPFPEIPRKRRKPNEQSNKVADFQTRFSRQGLPCRARIVFPEFFEEEIKDSFLTYEAVFGSLDMSESADATTCTLSANLVPEPLDVEPCAVEPTAPDSSETDQTVLFFY